MERVKAWGVHLTLYLLCYLLEAIIPSKEKVFLFVKRGFGAAVSVRSEQDSQLERRVLIRETGSRGVRSGVVS